MPLIFRRRQITRALQRVRLAIHYDEPVLYHPVKFMEPTGKVPLLTYLLKNTKKPPNLR